MKQLRILLIDEDDFLSEIYTEALEKDGYKVYTYGSGDGILEEVKKRKPHVIVLDILLPKVHGIDVLKQLKQKRSTNFIPVVMLSSLGQKKDVDAAMEYGADGYLIKSHNTPDDLRSLLDHMLASYKYENKDS